MKLSILVLFVKKKFPLKKPSQAVLKLFLIASKHKLLYSYKLGLHLI